MPGAGYNMQQQQQQVYDAPNCDYEPPKNFQQNFGNPYDCPEGFYNGSLMSSVGYSQVLKEVQAKNLVSTFARLAHPLLYILNWYVGILCRTEPVSSLRKILR